MDPDIGDDAARTLFGALPGHVVPPAARSDVRQTDVVPRHRALLTQPLAKRDQIGMQAQLQDRVDAASGLLLELLESVQIPGIDNERLLANRVSADAQSQPDVRIVQVVRRTDADEVYAARVGAAPQFLQMPIETLDLGEEAHVERVPIEHPDVVVRVDGGDQTVAGVLDRLEMARGHEAGHSGQREGSHRLAHSLVAQGPTPTPALADRIG